MAKRAPLVRFPRTIHERVEAYERRLVVQALRRARGDHTAGARLLGIEYHQMRYLAQKHGLCP